jgi:hypothetical protein
MRNARAGARVAAVVAQAVAPAPVVATAVAVAAVAAVAEPAVAVAAVAAHGRVAKKEQRRCYSPSA